MACLGLANPLSFLIAKSDLDCGITILLGVLDLKDPVTACFDHRRCRKTSFVVIEPSHPEFFS